MKVKSLSRVRLLVTPWTAAPQAPPSVGLSGREHWSGVPSPSPRHTHTPVSKIDDSQVPTVLLGELCSAVCGDLNGEEIHMGVDLCVRRDCPVAQMVRSLSARQETWA